MGNEEISVSAKTRCWNIQRGLNVELESGARIKCKVVNIIFYEQSSRMVKEERLRIIKDLHTMGLVYEVNAMSKTIEALVSVTAESILNNKNTDIFLDVSTTMEKHKE